MTVKAILSHKSPDIVSIEPTATLAQAAKLLAERRIGAVLVLGIEGRVAGILSERDIVRVIAEAGAAALTKPISSCMTRDVVFAQPEETVDALLARMTDRRIRHLPVCKGNRLAGIISIGDLVKYKIREAQAETEGLKAYIAAG
jgi:CBS domain-containing protein